MKDENLKNNVVSLHQRGWSIHKLSDEFGISRGRVRRIVESNNKERENGNTELGIINQRASKLDDHKGYIVELIEKYKDNPPTGQRIYEILKEKGYSGGITILRAYLTTIRAGKVKEVIRCVETSPGQRGAHDWSDYHIDFTLEGSVQVTFFSFILGYSRRQYIELVKDKTQTTLLQCLVNTFNYFEGVPHQIKSDNQKACVDRWEAGKPVFNKKYLEFATHYRFTPMAIHPGKPRENLKIERPFYYLETNFLNARTFKDQQDLAFQLREWLTEVNDLRIHRTTGRRPIDLYYEELPALIPLPMKDFDTSVIEYRVVNKESCIEWAGYSYAVPSEYLYELCPVRVTGEQITIYSPACLPVVSHTLAAKGSKEKYIGRTAPKDTSYRLKAKDIIARVESFGDLMKQYIPQLKKHHPSSYIHHLSHILSLRVNYQVADILMAVSRAMKYKVFESQSIENFLDNHAEKKNETLLR